MFQRLAFRHLEMLCVDVAVYLLVVGGDTREGVEIAYTPDGNLDGLLDIHQTVEEDGVEAVFLWELLRTVSAAHLHRSFPCALQLRIKGAGILAGLFPCMLEVEVHQVLVAAQHLTVELVLRESVEPLVGHHGVLAYPALTVKLCD